MNWETYKREEIKPLKIAMISYDRSNMKIAIDSFIDNNLEQIEAGTKKKITLKDGTEIVPIYKKDDLKGKYFDQMMICDDYRWNILSSNEDLISYTYIDLAYKSCVPEEFFTMKYEY